MSRYRFLFLLSACLLAAVIAGLGSTSLQRTLDTFQPLGIELVDESGHLTVESADEGTGLLPGDVLLLARNQEPADRDELTALLLSDAESPVLVKRGDGLERVLYVRPPKEIDPVALALAALGIFNLLIGLYTCFKDSRFQSVLFFFWCMASTALFLLMPRQVPLDRSDELIFLVDQGARLLLPALTWHLLTVFPSRLSSRPWLRLSVGLAYTPAALAIPFYVDQILLRGRFTGAPSAGLLALLDRLELLLVPVAFLAGALVLGLRIHRRPEWEHRRQLQWIVAGLVAGYVPFLVAYVLPWSFGLPTPIWSTLPAVAAMALVPLTFAYAIFKYKLLEMGAILRDAVSYAAAGLVAVFGFRIAQVVIDEGFGPDLGTARHMATFAAGLVIAGVLVPTRNAVSQGLEHLQHRGLWGRRRMLQALGGSLLHERNLGSLCSTLVDQLADGLVARVELYLVQGDGTLQPIRPGAELPALRRGDLGEELWQRQVGSLSAVHLPEEDATAEQRLFAAGYRYAFPLRVQGHAVGLVLMSYKFDEDPLDGEDLELVQGLLSQAALAIENARLLTEVRTKLDEVSRLEALNHGILESSPAGIAVLDESSRIVSANRTLAQICRAHDDLLVGSVFSDVLPVTLPEAGAAPIRIGFCGLDGDERYLQLQVAGYRDALIPATAGATINGPQRVLVVQDVTEQAILETQLREKEHMASLGMLAAGVAHEVNTPLTGISSYAQFMMASTAEDDPRFELLQKMERQTFRASQIVNNLLEFSRNRRGETGRVDLAAVLTESVTLLEVRAAKVHAELIRRGTSEPLHVLGNEGELHQVFTNLIANALDALQDHPSPRRVVVELEDLGTKRRVRVRDTGPGIPPERLQTIFKPFFSSKLGRGGSGLGLAITYNILRRHAGEIRAENHPAGDDGGCTFTVELPSYQTVTH